MSCRNVNLLDKLIAQQNKALAQEILSPVINGSPISVKMAGVIVTLRVKPKNFHGYGVFVANDDYKTATFKEEPARRQIREYLELLPRARVIICHHDEDCTVASLLNKDSRFDFDATRIFFGENLSLFDIVQIRFNGRYFLYEKHLRDFAEEVNTLKENFAAELQPSAVKTIKPLELPYRYAYEEMVKSKALTDEQRIKSAITRAGGTYHGFVDRGDTFTVRFSVNGEEFSPTVERRNLQLVNAGICLSGHDREHDLQSFVFVVSRGIDEGVIVRW